MATMARTERKKMEPRVSEQNKKMSSRYKTEFPNEVIEEQTKKIPNLLFLSAGLASMAGSLLLSLNKKQEIGNFVGQWVPTLLIFGLYNKVVKIEDELLKSRMH
jgi:hypothetical protein